MRCQNTSWSGDHAEPQAPSLLRQSKVAAKVGDTGKETGEGRNS